MQPKAEAQQPALETEAVKKARRAVLSIRVRHMSILSANNEKYDRLASEKRRGGEYRAEAEAYPAQSPPGPAAVP